MISDNDPEDLTPVERLAFNKLNRQKLPPQSLQEKTIKALHSENLLNPATSTRNLFTLWTLPKLSAAVIAASILFLLGFTVAQWQIHQNTDVTPKSLFALLIYDDDNFEGDPRVQGQEYGNWMFNMRDLGRYVTGQGLGKDGRILVAGAEQIQVRNLTASESYGTIGGFYVIEASSYDEAVEVASSCPHLKYNGTIEVRKIHY